MKALVSLFPAVLLIAGFAGRSFAEEKPHNGASISGADYQITNLDPYPEAFIPSDDHGSPHDGTFDDVPSYCGTPTETESNNSCATADRYVLHCTDVVFGFCDAPNNDWDFFRFVVPALTALTIWAEDGAQCNTRPTADIHFDLYNASCYDVSDDSRSGFLVRNLSATDSLVMHLRVRRRYSGSSSTPYKIATACCPIRNYCQEPIVVPAGTLSHDHYCYETTVNTCCAADVVDSVYRDTCGLGMYRSGPDVVFKVVLLTGGWLDSCLASGPGNNQVMIFTDCGSPRTSCVASSDKASPSAGGTEMITNLPLAAGVYYVSVSWSGADPCGDLTLRLVSDVPLAVELVSFEAIAGDGEVRLVWQTASESNNDRFEIFRNGVLAGRIPSTNLPSGDNYSWLDRGVENGVTYTYALSVVEVNGAIQELGTISATPRASALAVTEYALHQNYPNPFNATTRIVFDVVERGLVSLKVFNLTGGEVATLTGGMMDAGRHAVSFDARGLPSGVYWYRLEAGEFTAVRKMMLMK